jgi:tRNA-splicing ligase RtcB
MTIKKVLPGPRPVKIWTNDIDERSEQQLKNIAALPFIHKHIAAMPDVHLGIGATVGSVLATKQAIIPAAVGVDIGCGMNALKLNLHANELPWNLDGIRDAIEKAIPLGAGGAHQTENAPVKLSFGFKMLNNHEALQTKNIWRQLGTLGSGNHFIELCLDENQQVWIMLHSGSRGIGNTIGRHYIEKAKREMERWHISLPDPDLAYLPAGTDIFDRYVQAVGWAQDYALENRRVMMKIVLDVINEEFKEWDIHPVEEAINCHHNYVSLENHFGDNVYVTRKGAIRARQGELGIIPGSMGAKSFIVAGKGNPDSFCSCSHGAGRKMSRTAAKAQYTVDDLRAQTVGVNCRRNDSVIDEIPAAYKDIDQVMANQNDLVEIVHTLKQVLCVKG